MDKRSKVAVAMVEWFGKQFCLACHVDDLDYRPLLKSLGFEEEEINRILERWPNCNYPIDLLDRLVELLPAE